ncbi:hypothetical protein ACRHK7_01190 [Weissella tructae]|uniref:hypothetical protein n=1 Tax=Weissella tructae TaxID=887702 RepID=UPI003D8AB0BD
MANKRQRLKIRVMTDEEKQSCELNVDQYFIPYCDDLPNNALPFGDEEESAVPNTDMDEQPLFDDQEAVIKEKGKAIITSLSTTVKEISKGVKNILGMDKN